MPDASIVVTMDGKYSDAVKRKNVQRDQVLQQEH